MSNNGMIKKLVKIPVETPKGTKYLTFFRYVSDDKEDVCRPCEGICPYSEICDKIPDPRDPKNADLGFLDFCGSIGEGDGNEDLIDVIPVAGTVEENLKDVIGDVYQTIINGNKLVSIPSVIDEICPGWCDKYTEDHKNCVASNKSCLLRGLLLKTNESDTPIKE